MFYLIIYKSIFRGGLLGKKNSKYWRKWSLKHYTENHIQNYISNNPQTVSTLRIQSTLVSFKYLRNSNCCHFLGKVRNLHLLLKETESFSH